MPSFLEREQLVPVAPSIAPADQVLGAFGTRQSLFGIGAAQLKSAQSSYANMPLTNQGNQMQLDGLLKQAGTQIKQASVTDLSVGDNQSAALSVFDPILKDHDIMGDAALTKGWNADRSKAESDRVSNGGKNYNPDSLNAVNNQQALYAKSDKSTWRSFINSKESYNPYYNEFDETQKLTKGFKTDVIEKEEQKGAYITTTKNSSWYKDKWQQYFEANASPQLKAQVGQRARGEYYRDMLTMPREAIVQKYTNIRNGLIKRQMDTDANNMMNTAAQLAMNHDSKDNAGQRADWISQLNYLNDAYSAKKQALNSPLEGADAIGTVDGLAIGTRTAEALGQYQYFDKMGNAFAHKEEKFSIKPDYAYLSLRKIQEQAHEFGIRQSETGRHNRAMETHATNMEAIDMMKAQADLIRANKTKGGKSDGTGSSPFDDASGNPSGVFTTPKVDAASDSPLTQTQGQNILDRLGNVKKQYDEVYDNVASSVFSPKLMGTITDLANDPAKAGLKLSEVPDPTTATDGTGGDRARLLKFMVAAGALNEDAGGAMLGSITGQSYDPQKAAQDLTVSDARQLLRTIFSDPAMLQKGIAAIKGNDPSTNAYAIASEIEKKKQRIDGEHSNIVNDAVPYLRTNLGKYSGLFDTDFLSKGKIPTRDEVRKVMQNVPLSVIRENLPSNGSIFKSHPGFQSQDDYYKDEATDDVMKTILGTLGNNRTAYNTHMEVFTPDEGNPQKDTNFQKNVVHLLQEAEHQTKGLDSNVKAAIDYANNYPQLVERVDLHSVDEAHTVPYMQLYFKKASSSDRNPPSQGVEIPVAGVSRRFYEQPLDDRTTLLNNKSLKFQSQYTDGTKSNLSIYNTSGDKSNPMFDINSDFSYKTLDVDPKTGNIKGVRTIYKQEEINNITRGMPQAFSQAISVDPSIIYNTLADKLIKNRDAVNEYMKANGGIKNLNDLPDYIKNALRNTQ